MKLKETPEDFVVEESPVTFSGKGPYLVVKVWKRMLNTEEAAQILARSLGIPRKNISYAGAKDKRAVTTQYMSVKGVSDEKIRSFSHEKMTVKAVGRHDKPLSLGDLKGNRFTIVARELEKPLTPIKEFRNYFGEQRFGSENDTIGKLLVKKEFGEAAQKLGLNTGNPVKALRTLPRHTLLLYVHSYQSKIWNETLRSLEEPPEKLPLVGFGTELDEEPQEVREKYCELLREEGVSERDFIIRQIPSLSAEGDIRTTIIEVKDLEPGSFEDGVQRVSFSLPKGSYATVVMQELVR